VSREFAGISHRVGDRGDQPGILPALVAGRIHDAGLCTFCSGGRFPSYRRDGKTGRRIFNFLQLKQGSRAGA